MPQWVANFKAEFSGWNVAAVNVGELLSVSDNSQCLRTVSTVLCFGESDAKTDEWHISITPTKGSDWVQP